MEITPSGARPWRSAHGGHVVRAPHWRRHHGSPPPKAQRILPIHRASATTNLRLNAITLSPPRRLAEADFFFPCRLGPRPRRRRYGGNRPALRRRRRFPAYTRRAWNQSPSKTSATEILRPPGAVDCCHAATQPRRPPVANPLRCGQFFSAAQFLSSDWGLIPPCPFVRYLNLASCPGHRNGPPTAAPCRARPSPAGPGAVKETKPLAMAALFCRPPWLNFPGGITVPLVLGSYLGGPNQFLRRDLTPPPRSDTSTSTIPSSTNRRRDRDPGMVSSPHRRFLPHPAHRRPSKEAGKAGKTLQFEDAGPYPWRLAKGGHHVRLVGW